MNRFVIAGLVLVALVGAGCTSPLAANQSSAVRAEKTAPPTPPPNIPLPTPVHPEGT